jgi:hypothetical protein
VKIVGDSVMINKDLSDDQKSEVQAVLNNFAIIFDQTSVFTFGNWSLNIPICLDQCMICDPVY